MPSRMIMVPETLKRSSSDLFQTNMTEFQDCHLAKEL